MKKRVLIAAVAFLVLILVGCGSESYEFTMNETYYDVGYDNYYVSGEDVVIDPIIHVGYTAQRFKAGGNPTVLTYYNWYIEELSYTLYQEVDGEYEIILTDTLDSNIEESTYLSSPNQAFDYKNIFGEEVFDLGILDIGNYRYVLTTSSKYMNYQNGTSMDTSLGMETFEVATTVDFSVVEDAGMITTDILYISPEDSNNLNHTIDTVKSLVEGYDVNGNPLEAEDLIVVEDVMGRYYGGQYSTPEDTTINVLNYYRKINRFGDLGDPYDILYQVHTSLVSYETHNFNFDKADGFGIDIVLNILNRVVDVDEELFLTFKIDGSSVYKRIRIIYQEDTTPPVFTQEPEDQTITEGESLDISSLFPTATDDLFGDVSENITVNITDTTSLSAGEHTVTFTVEDSFGNVATSSFTLTVLPVDTDAPEIEIVDWKPTTFEVGDTLPDFTTYFIISDHHDGPIMTTESMLSWEVEIDANTAGVYQLTINVMDNAGNTATESISFTIVESQKNTAPEFNFYPDSYAINEGEMVDLLELEIAASDQEDGDLTSSITVDVTDTSVLSAGNYNVTYSVTDSDGETVTVVMILTVEAALEYSGEVTLAEADTSHTIYVEFDVEMLDNYFVDLDAFTVLINGGAATIEDVYVGMYDITIIIEQTITEGSQINLSYIRTGTDDLTYDGYLVAEFVTQPVDTSNVDNSADFTGEVVEAYAYDSSTIDIIFDVNTFDGFYVDQSAFTIYVDGVEATILSDFVNINTVTLTIDISMTFTSVITVSYAPTGNSDLSYGGTLVPSFTDFDVISPA